VLTRRLQKLQTPAVTGPLDSKENLLADFSTPELERQLVSFDREWSELEGLQKETGIPFAVIVLPFRQQIVPHPEWQAPQAYMREKCAATSLHCLDPWAMFREHQGEDLYTPSSSMHFSPGGSRLLADWLADNLRDVLAESEPRPPL
jgi:hypothetical protein